MKILPEIAIATMAMMPSGPNPRNCAAKRSFASVRMAGFEVATTNNTRSAFAQNEAPAWRAGAKSPAHWPVLRHSTSRLGVGDGLHAGAHHVGPRLARQQLPQHELQNAAVLVVERL